ncbi:MAG TPA: response regulator transcription factor [Oceanipulchritudo sp.]|nr:response regulator transcription factor [Oceanipulchritudo sp.]
MKTIIIEDQKLGIDLIRQCLTDKFELVATCQTIKDGWKAFEKYQPEVVILDIELPDGSGLDLANRILKANPKIRILGVSGRTDEYTLYRVFMTGLFGFVDKNTESIDELKKAVVQLGEGNCYYAATVQQNMLIQKTDPMAFSKILTEREQELLRYIGAGASNEKIAEQLDLRPVSVQNHKARIMRKLNLHTTVDLIRYAMQKGFVNQTDFQNLNRGGS